MPVFGSQACGLQRFGLVKPDSGTRDEWDRDFQSVLVVWFIQCILLSQMAELGPCAVVLCVDTE